MPNHVITNLRIDDLSDSDLTEVHATFLNDAGKVDFNVICEMPECLKDFSPHMGILSRAKMALGLLPDIQSLSNGDGMSSMIERLEVSNALRDASTPIKPDEVIEVIRAISNHKQCGYMYWYDWSNDHWGTKWNAYDQPDEGFEANATEFEFQTAWSHPHDLINRLSDRNPDVTFSVEYADEDIGSNCGTYTIKAGQRIAERIAPPWSDQTDEQKAEFTAFAFKMHYGDDDPASHGYDENWQYSEEVYEAANASS